MLRRTRFSCPSLHPHRERPIQTGREMEIFNPYVEAETNNFVLRRKRFTRPEHGVHCTYTHTQAAVVTVAIYHDITQDVRC